MRASLGDRTGDEEPGADRSDSGVAVGGSVSERPRATRDEDGADDALGDAEFLQVVPAMVDRHGVDVADPRVGSGLIAERDHNASLVGALERAERGDGLVGAGADFLRALAEVDDEERVVSVLAELRNEGLQARVELDRFFKSDSAQLELAHAL